MDPVQIETTTDIVTLQIWGDQYGLALGITWGDDDDWPSAYLNEGQALRAILAMATRYNHLFGDTRRCNVNFGLVGEE